MEDWQPRRSGHDRRLAHLAAGHVVIGILEGLEIPYASIEPEGLKLRRPVPVGYNTFALGYRSTADTAKWTSSVIRTLLGGPACQIRYSFGDYPTKFNLAGRCIVDQAVVWHAIALAVKITNDSPALIHALWDQVTKTVGDSKVWAAVERVANTLLNRRMLLGSELVAAVRQAG